MKTLFNVERYKKEVTAREIERKITEIKFT